MSKKKKPQERYLYKAIWNVTHKITGELYPAGAMLDLDKDFTHLTLDERQMLVEGGFLEPVLVTDEPEAEPISGEPAQPENNTEVKTE